MERAHVLIRLQQPPPPSSDAFPRKPGADGVTRTSATTVRLEHSDMSPGVASITFEQVYDQQHASAHVFAQSLAPAVAKCAQGFAATLVLTGAPRSGKSFTCHGDKQQRATGMVTLALRQVFKELERMQESEPAFEYQVLLCCFHVVDAQLVDLLQTPPVHVRSSAQRSTAEMLLQRSVLVANSAEAVHCYSQAHAASLQATSGESDFVVAVHVESKRPNEQVRRGRFTCIDIHGSSILEPTRWQDTSPEFDAAASGPTYGRPFFSDTHFPVATVLSDWFGGFVGNDAATYMLVTIQKQAQYQQQAIQSLLYACKAKDIKSSCAITYATAFTSKEIAPQQQKCTNDSPEKSTRGNDDMNASGNQIDAREDLPPGSPVSATSSDSTGEFAMASNDTGFERLTDSAGALVSLDQSEKQTILSQRLRKAYQSVKSSSLSDPLNSTLAPKSNPADVESGRGKHDRFEGLFATKANFLHAKADAMLKPRANELQALSLLDKLDLIHAQHQETEKALVQETSIKEKCVDRISKLSQTMSFQVIEHEKQMQQVLQEKERVQTQLTAMELKFEGVSREIEQLQQQKRIEEIAHKMERKKKKMEKKMKALASDKKVLKTASSQRVLELAHQIEDFELTEQQMQTELAGLRKTMQQHESNETQLRSEIEQLQHSSSKLERRLMDLQEKLAASEIARHDLVDERQAAEAAFQRQIYEMEQSLARRLLERESQLAAEHERKLRKLMDRHSAELLQRDVHDESMPRSTSSLSTLASTISDFETSSPCPRPRQLQQQQSIDQLDALIDSKEKQYARSKDNTLRSDRKKPPSARQEQKLAELKKKLGELTQALAVANEQETLAKAQAQKIVDAHQESLSQRDHLLEEMNRLKNENWSLSLALQVTERQRQ